MDETREGHAYRRAIELRKLLDEAELNGDISTHSALKMILNMQIEMARDLSAIRRDSKEALASIHKNPSITALMRRFPKLSVAVIVFLVAHFIPSLGAYSEVALKAILAFFGLV